MRRRRDDACEGLFAVGGLDHVEIELLQVSRARLADAFIALGDKDRRIAAWPVGGAAPAAGYTPAIAVSTLNHSRTPSLEQP